MLSLSHAECGGRALRRILIIGKIFAHSLSESTNAREGIKTTKINKMSKAKPQSESINAREGIEIPQNPYGFAGQASLLLFLTR